MGDAALAASLEIKRIAFAEARLDGDAIRIARRLVEFTRVRPRERLRKGAA